jgi:hypothetical protein
MQEDKLRTLIELTEAIINNTPPGVSPKALLIVRHSTGNWQVVSRDYGSVTFNRIDTPHSSLESALAEFITKR